MCEGYVVGRLGREIDRLLIKSRFIDELLDDRLFVNDI